MAPDPDDPNYCVANLLFLYIVNQINTFPSLFQEMTPCSAWRLVAELHQWPGAEGKEAGAGEAQGHRATVQVRV